MTVSIVPGRVGSEVLEKSEDWLFLGVRISMATGSILTAVGAPIAN